jgi:hypothetical protein
VGLAAVLMVGVLGAREATAAPPAPITVTCPPTLDSVRHTDGAFTATYPAGHVASAAYDAGTRTLSCQYSPMPSPQQRADAVEVTATVQGTSCQVEQPTKVLCSNGAAQQMPSLVQPYSLPATVVAAVGGPTWPVTFGAQRCTATTLSPASSTSTLATARFLVLGAFATTTATMPAKYGLCTLSDAVKGVVTCLP